MQKTARFTFTALICLFLVRLAAAQVHPAVYSNGSLKGPYSSLTNKWLSDQSDYPCASLGIVNFDGVGSFTVSSTQNCAGTVNTFTGSGTYSVAKDGTGTMTGSLSGISGTFTDAIVLNSAGKSGQMVQTSCTFCGSGTWVVAGTFIAVGGSSFKNASLKKGYEFMLTKWTSGQNSDADCTVGIATFDGKGNAKLSGTDVYAGSVQTITASGPYTVNSDGSGSMTGTDQNGNTITIAFLINSAGKGLQLMKTAESGGHGINEVHTGTATKQ